MAPFCSSGVARHAFVDRCEDQQILACCEDAQELIKIMSTIVWQRHFFDSASLLALRRFFSSLERSCGCSLECFVLSLVYMDRIAALRSQRLSPRSPQDVELQQLAGHPLSASCQGIEELLAATILLAAKFHDDIHYSNAYYAKVTNLTIKELNVIESEILRLLDWDLFVSGEDFACYVQEVRTCEHNMQLDVKRKEKLAFSGNMLSPEPRIAMSQKMVEQLRQAVLDQLEDGVPESPWKGRARRLEEHSPGIPSVTVPSLTKHGFCNPRDGALGVMSNRHSNCARTWQRGPLDMTLWRSQASARLRDIGPSSYTKSSCEPSVFDSVMDDSPCEVPTLLFRRRHADLFSRRRSANTCSVSRGLI